MSSLLPSYFPAAIYLNRCFTKWCGRRLLQVHPCDAQPLVGNEPPWLSLLYAFARLPRDQWPSTMTQLSNAAQAGQDAAFLATWLDAAPSAPLALQMARALLPDCFAPAGPVAAHPSAASTSAEQIELELIRQWMELNTQRWGGPSVSLTVLLVGLEGVPCELDLQVIELPAHLAQAHGCLVRAPAAALLALDSDFQAGLSQVQSLLQRVLMPLDASAQPAAPRAVAWRLRALDKQDGSGNLVPLYFDELTGPSLSAALAVGCLWLLRDHLAEPWRVRWHQRLREIKPEHFCATAAFAGYEAPAPHQPDGFQDDPLQWVLAPVGGVALKFDALFHHRPNRRTISKAFVAQHQDVSGTLVTAVKCTTLATLIEEAHQASEPLRLPPAYEALEDALIGASQEGGEEDRREQAVSVPQPLLDAVHSAPLPKWLKAGQPPTQDEAEKVLRVWWLKRFAHWASGRYQAFGPLRGGPTEEPVALTEHFHPIAIDPERRDDAAQGAQGGERQARELLQANSLPELFTKCPHDTAFRLHAAPAGGKTTLLAHHELHTAQVAIDRHVRSGQWGELALWLPMRDYPTRLATDAQAAVDALWARVSARYPDLAAVLRAWLDGHVVLPGLRLRWLCDAVNEMPADGETQRRLAQTALFRGLTEQGAAHGWLAPVFTVRTHSQNQALSGARGCTLLTWDAPSRLHYMEKRLGANSPAFETLRAAIEADPRADREKFFATPGHLAAQCTLMAAGIVSEPARDRAQLFCTLLWLRLAQELQKEQLPAALLSADELERIDRMPDCLVKPGGWRWPKRMGPLMQALTAMAVYQQHLDPDSRSRQRQQGEEGERVWSMTAPRDWLLNPPYAAHDTELKGPSERELLRAAQHLNLLVPDDDGEHLSWTHQLWLELFAALGLNPGDFGNNWLDAPVPVLPEMEDLWEAHQLARKPRNQFRIPHVPALPEEETLRHLIQLRGDVVPVVQRVLAAGNAPLAARLALENWAAFGEPVYPQEDCLNPWREDKTHRVLNDLRQELHKRMYSEQVHISQRVEAGDLLGQLGGSPLYEICGQALILKDEYWMPIGRPGERYSFEMGDLEGNEDERTAQGQLLSVSLQPFHMAGYLLTNAQYRCFVQSGSFGDAAWWRWPGEARAWWTEEGEKERQPWSLRKSDANEYGLGPVAGNFWQAQAYARWEQAQRREGARLREGEALAVPTEAQWEGGARWARVSQDSGMNTQADGAAGKRWCFAHTAGERAPTTSRESGTGDACAFSDVRPWDFNHDGILGWRFSPVGVFVESQTRHPNWPECWALHDLAGNVWEWCSSAYDGTNAQVGLGKWVETTATGGDLRALRGGSYEGSAKSCRAGRRGTREPHDFGTGDFGDFGGFRLVMAVGL